MAFYLKKNTHFLVTLTHGISWVSVEKFATKFASYADALRVIQKYKLKETEILEIK